MLRGLASLALRALPPSWLSVLIYHRVLPAPDPLLAAEPTAEAFEQTMRWLKSAFNVLPLADGIAGLRAGRLPARALAITFDDGYANNETIAAPILARLGLPATFFIASGYLDGGRMFNDTVIEAVRGCPGSELDLQAIGLGRHPVSDQAERRAAIAAILEAIKYRCHAERTELAERVAEIACVSPSLRLMMTSQQVVRLHRMGFTLGAHTVNHPILAQLDDAAARREIELGRRRVAELADGPVSLFAYPNGRPDRDYTARTVRLVREAGFAGAVTTSPGAARIGSDPFEVPRFTPWDDSTLRFAARMWLNVTRVAPRYAAA